MLAGLLSTGVANAQNASSNENDDFKAGKTSYTPQPKNAWELGVHFGNFVVAGDVDYQMPNLGVGLHLRKAINYVFSLRGDFFYGQAKGLDPQFWTHSSFGGGLVEPSFDAYQNTNTGWFPSYRTRMGYASLQGVINIGNILFHKERNTWNLYTALGIGLSTHSTMLDLLDEGGNPYADMVNRAGYTAEKFDTRAGRKEIKDAVKGIYDGTYETAGPKQAGVFRLGDDTNLNTMFSVSVGVSRKLSKRLNLALEHQVMFMNTDLLDGIRYNSATSLTPSRDVGHYTNLRLGINLGSFEKRTEPLYWMNPLDQTMNDIAELKRRPVLDLTDSDGDGIIDMLDQEINSPSGAMVDTRGVTLDSDKDGIADYKDKEPFSAPGYKVDKDGVAMTPKYTTEAQVNQIVDEKIAGLKKAGDCGRWYLPMIHFDLNRSAIKSEAYGQLHHVANVMKMCPSTCVTVEGHADSRGSESYNENLSYERAKVVVDYLVAKYGIERSRFKLDFDGEQAPIIKNTKRSTDYYMNRRVEFRVCAPDDVEKPAPVKATKMKGNKNSGF